MLFALTISSSKFRNLVLNEFVVSIISMFNAILENNIEFKYFALSSHVVFVVYFDVTRIFAVDKF